MVEHRWSSGTELADHADRGHAGSQRLRLNARPGMKQFAAGEFRQKSKCHHERGIRRLSRAQADRGLLCTTFSISMSSTLRRSAADISPSPVWRAPA